MKKLGEAVRINITMPEPLLREIDNLARHDFTTRSDIIRQSLLEYLRPGGLSGEQVTPEELLQYLQRRKLGRALNKMRKDLREEQKPKH